MSAPTVVVLVVLAVVLVVGAVFVAVRRRAVPGPDQPRTVAELVRMRAERPRAPAPAAPPEPAAPSDPAVPPGSAEPPASAEPVAPPAVVEDVARPGTGGDRKPVRRVGGEPTVPPAARMRVQPTPASLQGTVVPASAADTPWGRAARMGTNPLAVATWTVLAEPPPAPRPAPGAGAGTPAPRAAADADTTAAGASGTAVAGSSGTTATGTGTAAAGTAGTAAAGGAVAAGASGGGTSPSGGVSAGGPAATGSSADGPGATRASATVPAAGGSGATGPAAAGPVANGSRAIGFTDPPPPRNGLTATGATAGGPGATGSVATGPAANGSRALGSVDPPLPGTGATTTAPSATGPAANGVLRALGPAGTATVTAAPGAEGASRATGVPDVADSSGNVASGDAGTTGPARPVGSSVRPLPAAWTRMAVRGRDGAAAAPPGGSTAEPAPAQRRGSAGAPTAEQAAAGRSLQRTFGIDDDRAPVVALRPSDTGGLPVVVPAPAGPPQPVRLRAVGRDGAPVVGAVATLLDDRGRESSTVTAGPDGVGLLLAPHPGGYVVVFTAPAHQPGAAALTVADGPVEVELLLALSASLCGSVCGESGPLAGARVALLQDGETVGEVATGSDGTYRLDDLAGGEYDLRVTAGHREPVTVPVDLPDGAELRRDVDLPPARLTAGERR